MKKHKAIDYQNDAFAYEMEERARPDEMAMLNCLGEVSNRYLDHHENVSVLDLCCGTGLSIENILFHKNINKIVGVDNCANYLNYAKVRFNKVPKLSFVDDDAVEVSLPTKSWDLIIMASSYHHIEDERKLKYMRKVQELLSPRGMIVMAENLLPEYENNKESYKDAVKQFYTEVLDTALTANPKLPEKIKSLIWRVAQHGFDGDYEYKTSLSILESLLAQARLRIEATDLVWPAPGSPLLDKKGGNYVFIIKSAI